eukprot:1634279-Rhodomonas_salina.3
MAKDGNCVRIGDMLGLVRTPHSTCPVSLRYTVLMRIMPLTGGLRCGWIPHRADIGDQAMRTCRSAYSWRKSTGRDSTLPAHVLFNPSESNHHLVSCPVTGPADALAMRCAVLTQPLVPSGAVPVPCVPAVPGRSASCRSVRFAMSDADMPGSGPVRGLERGSPPTHLLCDVRY